MISVKENTSFIEKRNKFIKIAEQLVDIYNSILTIRSEKE